LTIYPYHYVYCHIKTTIDLPDALLHQAKITAARRRTTLKDLVVEGLEYIIHAPSVPVSGSSTVQADDASFEMDVYGVPVLKRRGVTVTNAFERMREEEGI
jgi:hypothetical protein